MAAKDGSFAQAQAAALSQALPAAIRARRSTINASILVAVVSLVVAVTAIGLGEEGRVIGGFAAGFGAVVIIVLFREIHRKQEKIILPILCETLGLNHQKGEAEFLKRIPAEMIPFGDTQQVDDIISGTINGHDFSFAEVVTYRGKKMPIQAFRGIVLRMCKSNHPDLLAAFEDETYGSPMFPANVLPGDMDRIGSFRTSSGKLMGLWMPRKSAGIIMGDATISAFRHLAQDVQTVLDGAELYSIRVCGTGLFVALRMNRDLFRLAGPTADETQLIESINVMSADLALPGLLAEQVVQTSTAYQRQPSVMQ